MLLEVVHKIYNCNISQDKHIDLYTLIRSSYKLHICFIMYNLIFTFSPCVCRVSEW